MLYLNSESKFGFKGGQAMFILNWSTHHTGLAVLKFPSRLVYMQRPGVRIA